jgi:hypothetical protein
MARPDAVTQVPTGHRRERTMSGWYELRRNAKGQFWFVLHAGHAEAVLRSEPCASRASALNGIAAVQTNSPRDERYERLTAGDGPHYFNLRAPNGRVVGTSEMYPATSMRDDGIASVMTHGPTTEIREL